MEQEKAIELRQASKEERKIMDRMEELGIRPIRATMEGLPVRVYLIDKNGHWIGTTQQPNETTQPGGTQP